MGLDVRDGNCDAPIGARLPLYGSPVMRKAGAIKATPDIVVTRVIDGLRVIIEVKYKPLKGLPSRDDVNQAITYASVYRTGHVFLAYPRRQTGQPVIEEVGIVGSISLSVILVDLDCEDLGKESAHVTASFADYLAKRLSVTRKD